MITIPVKRLPHGKTLDLPRYMTGGSVGMDLCAAVEETQTLAAGERALIPTGLALAIPEGYEAQVRGRSGLAYKNQVVVLNCPGTIDQDYRGEVKVILKNLSDVPFEITRGMRVAQLIFAPIQRILWDIVETLEAPKERGAGGFGSTGT